jgi:hypothetical protein
MGIIDINFDVFSDTPKGKDPDSYSATLRRYHKVLWSKPLPSGAKFDLNENTPQLLHHKSGLGEFFLSSDAIGVTFLRYWEVGRSNRGLKRMSHIVNQIPGREIDSFFSACSTIGAYIIFPSRTIDNKMTINQARGINPKIQDRFDLTLECIRRFYLSENSPLTDTLERYSLFFNLFQDFRGYVDFFLLQDLITEDYSSIKYSLPFKSFDNPPLPNNVDEYLSYKSNLTDFVKSRNQRILDATSNGV